MHESKPTLAYGVTGMVPKELNAPLIRANIHVWKNTIYCTVRYENKKRLDNETQTQNEAKLFYISVY